MRRGRPFFGHARSCQGKPGGDDETEISRCFAGFISLTLSALMRTNLVGKICLSSVRSLASFWGTTRQVAEIGISISVQVCFLVAIFSALARIIMKELSKAQSIERTDVSRSGWTAKESLGF